MNTTPNNIPDVLKGHTDTRWDTNTIYNHYQSPIDFMNDVINTTDIQNTRTKELITSGKEKYSNIHTKNTTYSKLYKDVATKVKDKLHAKGLTSKLLYGDVEFTSEKTGCLSKTRLMLGKRDCYFKQASMTDGKLFHDIYINLSYSDGIDDSTIVNNSYALYALVQELSRLVAIRVIVVNHTGHRPYNLCYSYMLKQFKQPINPEEFLFFTSDSKRTFGWATYDMLSPRDTGGNVGQPTNTVSIANFNLDTEIDTIWDKLKLTLKI